MIGLVAGRDAVVKHVAVKAVKAAKHAVVKVVKHAVVKAAKHVVVKAAKHAVVKAVKDVVAIRDAEDDREMVAGDVVHAVVIRNQSHIVSLGRKKPNPSAMQCRRAKNRCVRSVI